MAEPFKEVLSSGKFVVTSEVGPPKGTNLEETLHNIDLLKDRVDAINLTDNQSSVMRYPSVGGCLLVKERGGEPILQMTCRDRNRLALQADLLFAYSRGVRNVLCLTGDSIPVGDHAEAKGVFDLDSVQLLTTVCTPSQTASSLRVLIMRPAISMPFCKPLPFSTLSSSSISS